MSKFVIALCIALIGGWALVASAADANANHRRGHGCANCGPYPPSYSYKTKKVHKHVTRIQPVVHVHKVTRVHTRLVRVPYPVHRHVTQVLPVRHHVTSSVVYLRPHCGCAY